MVCVSLSTRAGTLDELLGRKDLTPADVARHVADFSFELAPQVQAPETFLQRRKGDCADFANLASIVLNKHGYTTKLVVVMMTRQTHVVCYVKEAGGFLDYNHRKDPHPIIKSSGSLDDIAGKVASFFRSEWNMASFFKYQRGSPVYLDCAFPLETRPTAKAPAHKGKAPVAIQAVVE